MELIGTFNSGTEFKTVLNAIRSAVSLDDIVIFACSEHYPYGNNLVTGTVRMSLSHLSIKLYQSVSVSSESAGYMLLEGKKFIVTEVGPEILILYDPSSVGQVTVHFFNPAYIKYYSDDDSFFTNSAVDFDQEGATNEGVNMFGPTNREQSLTLSSSNTLQGQMRVYKISAS